MTAPKKLAAGNWKMNGSQEALSEVDQLSSAYPAPGCGIVICPPATLIPALSERARGTAIKVGAQDCHAEVSGAHTGDISAKMLAEAGADFVILGHSERRGDHGETDDQVRAKLMAAVDAGLTVIICVGETLEQRDGGSTLDVVRGQLSGSIPDGLTAANLVVAYEPVWAIGTGKVPTTEQIAEVHDLIRSEMTRRFADGAAMTLLYGGSVKAANAEEIFAVANVDGALVGGASLRADDFTGIIRALEAS
ncbi:triose-phosphate isomerase [Mesobaculum littorinae]|uniref:Triosephosphate isomerase n=1 Tax=Mesobaculum littorinae TaxID=2486419 RepID=A0A438AM82_9RHOB|nr:triose-phosphate isomerase [Mesobaculum littorinae]RVV99760.1 triose-phosphate isomerase [Mesobaculum littorinae]